MKDNTTLIDVHHHYNPLFNTKLPEPLNSRLKNEMEYPGRFGVYFGKQDFLRHTFLSGN